MSLCRYLSNIVEDVITKLEHAACIKVDEQDGQTVRPLILGIIASYYYLKYVKRLHILRYGNLSRPLLFIFHLSPFAFILLSDCYSKQAPNSKHSFHTYRSRVLTRINLTGVNGCLLIGEPRRILETNGIVSMRHAVAV